MSKSKSSEYPQLVLRVSFYEESQVTTLRSKGLTVREIFEHICNSLPSDITITTRSGETVIIPKSIITKKS